MKIQKLDIENVSGDIDIQKTEIDEQSKIMNELKNKNDIVDNVK